MGRVLLRRPFTPTLIRPVLFEYEMAYILADLTFKFYPGLSAIVLNLDPCRT